MLLPSILSILDHSQVPSKLSGPERPNAPPGPEESTSLQKIELELAAAAELAKPSTDAPQPAGNPPAGPFLEELLRAITKFEKSDQSRVVDVFE